MPDQIRFRRVLGHFTTGVTLVTSRCADGSPCGLTANSFASVSLDPLLVLVCLDRTSFTHDCVLEGGVFAVCVLSSEDRELAARFSAGDRTERFEGLDIREEVTGSPILEGALAWMDCRVRDVHRAGDHSIVVSEVLAFDARDGEPLVFFRGAYHRIGT